MQTIVVLRISVLHDIIRREQAEDFSMKLIRYMPLEYGLKSVMSGEFKLLRPLDANDPYEMMGAVKGELKPEVESRLLDDMRYKWVTERMKIGVREKCPNNFQEVEMRVKNYKNIWRKTIMERGVQQENQVLSFADAFEIDGTSDQLLWGHYAEGGRGVRIWFDSELFPVELSIIKPIQYSPYRPYFDLGELSDYRDTEVMKDYLLNVLFTKSDAWAYEKEQRLLIPFKIREKFVINHDKLEFVRIPQQAITRIDFGPKGTIYDTEKQIDELKKNPMLNNVDFRVATFDECGYSYRYECFQA